mgnify:CR=1 FL=1
MRNLAFMRVIEGQNSVGIYTHGGRRRLYSFSSLGSVAHFFQNPNNKPFMDKCRRKNYKIKWIAKKRKPTKCELDDMEFYR